MNNDIDNAARDQETDKQVYQAPKLTDHGTVSEITLTTTTPSGTQDGGGFPNIYAS